MTKRPRRRELPDRLLAPDATQNEIRCDVAVAPFDRACREMDRKWGTDRLPELVSIDTAAKWGRTMARLNQALQDGDPDETARIAKSAVRGLAAMNAEAEAVGKEPCNLWEYDLDGFRFAIIEDNRRWHEVKDRRPDLVVFTMREAGLALQALLENGDSFLAKTKEHFPSAEAVRVTTKTKPREPLPKDFFERGGDAIPF